MKNKRERITVTNGSAILSTAAFAGFVNFTPKKNERNPKRETKEMMQNRNHVDVDRGKSKLRVIVPIVKKDNAEKKQT